MELEISKGQKYMHGRDITVIKGIPNLMVFGVSLLRSRQRSLSKKLSTTGSEKIIVAVNYLV
jgi:hypothetical protein